jgi:hypothetical protein
MDYGFEALAADGVIVPSMTAMFPIFKELLGNVLTVRKISRDRKKLLAENADERERCVRITRLLMDCSEAFFFTEKPLHYMYAFLKGINVLKEMPEIVPEYVVCAAK